MQTPKVLSIIFLFLIISVPISSGAGNNIEMLEMREFTTHGAPQTTFGAWQGNGRRLVRKVTIKSPKDDKIQACTEIYYGGKTGRIDRSCCQLDPEPSPLSPRY
ncbi:MAG: hypothetical protein Athens071425_405 [Parcubacteria group bacterium Athens0714_25]|nr:MAG: hypothetical protein Athens071425_405 [Parcubacteria group bacterium Athens0714_25]